MASYPNTVRTFTSKINFTTVVDQAHPNDLQDEIVAVETTLGANPQVSTSVSATSTFNKNAAVYTSVAARLANIEGGVTGDVHTQYLKISSFTVKGALAVGTGGGNVTSLPPSVDGYYLTTDSTSASGLAWISPPASSVKKSGDAMTGPLHVQVDNATSGTLGRPAVRVGNAGALFAGPATSSNSSTFLSDNLYWNGQAYVYTNTSSVKSTLLQLTDGGLTFYSAPPGTAGATATLTEELSQKNSAFTLRPGVKSDLDAVKDVTTLVLMQTSI